MGKRLAVVIMAMNHRGSVKCGQFLEQLNDYQLLKEDS